MPDERRFERPLFILDRKGKVIGDNMGEFLAWRNRTDLDAYNAAMNGLAEVIAEAAVRQFMREAEIGQPGFGFAEACRIRMLSERESRRNSGLRDGTHTNPGS